MGIIQGILNYVLWYPCAMILSLLDAVGKCLEWLTSDLLEYILFGGKVNSFADIIIPATYYRMAIIGLGVWVVIFLVSIINYYRKDMLEHDDTNLGKMLKGAVKYSSFGLVIVVLTPLLLWFLLKMVGVLNDGVLIAFGSSEQVSLGQSLYNIGNPNPSKVTGNVDYYSMPSNIGEWNMVVQLLGLVITFLCCILIMIQVVVTLFTMYFYFILTSIFALLAVVDEGKRMKEYAQTMIASNLIVCSTMLIFNIFGSLLQVALGAMQRVDMDKYAAMLVSLILVVGGALFAVKGNEYVTRIVGQDIPGVSSAMSNLGMVTAGLGFSALIAKGAMNAAFGKKVGGGASSLAGGVTSALGSGVNAVKDSMSGGDFAPTSAEGMARAGQDVMQKKANAVTGRSGGGFGFVGKALGGASKTLNFAKNSVGAMFGHKPSRQAVKDSMKAGTNSIKNVGKKIAGGAAFVGGALGIQQTIGAIKSSNSYAKASMRKNFNPKAKENFDKNGKYIEKFGGINRNQILENEAKKNVKKVNKLMHLGKIKQANKIENKFTLKIEKEFRDWEKYEQRNQRIDSKIQKKYIDKQNKNIKKNK